MKLYRAVLISVLVAKPTFTYSDELFATKADALEWSKSRQDIHDSEEVALQRICKMTNQEYELKSYGWKFFGTEEVMVKTK